MSIIKDLIHISIYMLALLTLVITNMSTSALICFLLVSSIYWFQYIELKKVLKKEKTNTDILKEKFLNQQEAFTEILRHDLKVPIIAQLRGLELLNKEIAGTINSTQKDIIVHLEQSCNYILEMISTVLATYKLELEGQLCYERLDVSELLLESFVEVSPLSQEKNVTFTYMATQKNAIADVDRKGLKTVIINLLTTAIMYSAKNEKILVNITTKNNELKFSIITRGLALSKHECKTMFENYSETKPKYTSVGHDISLYLAKKIIEVHNGKIYASTDSNVTNTFNFIIPQFKQEIGFEKVDSNMLFNDNIKCY